ncbi:cytochrome P450 [Streptomyces sp. NPDC056160]|uniref:cytochrome P450 n=1 Tax=Streptomyces sp. NPDC056160 TaxID=3345731 RepID=UPI0035D87FF0
MAVPAVRVPIAPGRLPGVGHALRLRRDALKFLKSLPQYGDMVRIDLGPRSAYVVNTPELVCQVLVGEARKFHKGRLFDKARPFMGNGVMLSNGEFHLQQRRLVQPAFHRQRINGYVRIMGELASATADSLSPGQVVDMRDTMYNLVISILGKTVFSTELGGWATIEAQRSMPIIQDMIAKRTISPLTFLEKLPTPGNRRFDRAIAALGEVLNRIIEEYREDDTDYGDLLSMLVAARDQETGEGMSVNQMRDEIVNILAAGMETTTDTLSWTYHELGQHPEVEQQAYEEAERVLSGRPATVDDLAELEYLQCVIKEVLRVHPPANLIMRKTIAPVELNGIPLPIDTEVIVSPFLLHHNPRLFLDPSRFDPERWNREETASLPRGTFVPFGMGNRQCLGDTFAMTEMPVILATIIRRWRLRPLPGHTVRPVQAVTVSPGKLPMITEPRFPPTGVNY